MPFFCDFILAPSNLLPWNTILLQGYRQPAKGAPISLWERRCQTCPHQTRTFQYYYQSSSGAGSWSSLQQWGSSKSMVTMVTMGGDLQPGCLADRLLTGLGQPQINPKAQKKKTRIRNVNLRTREEKEKNEKGKGKGRLFGIAFGWHMLSIRLAEDVFWSVIITGACLLEGWASVVMRSIWCSFAWLSWLDIPGSEH